MIEQVIYTTEAEADIAEAYQWYEDREPGLGEDFLRCIEACVTMLQRHPLMHRIAVDSFRRALIRRFPYEIFYEPEDRCLIIYSLFHCSQEPKKLRDRLAGKR
jgi:plasmid stabilization system protein ParE